MTRNRSQTKKTSRNSTPEPHVDAPMSFMDHVRELQARLFAVAVVFLIAAALAYPFSDHIIKFIVAPFGAHELVYLTPGGAFGFVIQVCMYVGFVVALPVIVYHAYKFLLPVMPAVHLKRAIGFTAASSLLAFAGIAFSYYVSLPAALYFLTGFDLENISAMVTIDSYLSFAMAYLIAGALLFQLPLLTLMIDSITPLTPKKLMGYQRHLILGAFIVAAIISPTPDALNQTLLAGPIIVMYQLGIILVAVRHRRRVLQEKRAKRHQVALPPVDDTANDEELPAIPEPKPHPSLSLSTQRARKPANRQIRDIQPVRRTRKVAKKGKAMEFVVSKKPKTLPPKQLTHKPVAAQKTVATPPQPASVDAASIPPKVLPTKLQASSPAHSVDGMRPRRVSVPSRPSAPRQYQPFGPPRPRQSVDGVL